MKSVKHRGVGKIAKLESNEKTTNRLSSLGLMQGTEIKVLQKTSNASIVRVVKTGDTFGIGRKLVDEIFVSTSDEFVSRCKKKSLKSFFKKLFIKK